MFFRFVFISNKVCCVIVEVILILRYSPTKFFAWMWFHKFNLLPLVWHKIAGNEDLYKQDIHKFDKWSKNDQTLFATDQCNQYGFLGLIKSWNENT